MSIDPQLHTRFPIDTLPSPGESESSDPPQTDELPEQDQIEYSSSRLTIDEGAREKLREMEETEGVIWKEIATTLGFGRAAICRWKQGTRRTIQVKDALKINKYFTQNYQCSIFDIPSLLPSFQKRSQTNLRIKKNLEKINANNYSDLTCIKIDEKARNRLKQFRHNIDSLYGKRKYWNLQKLQKISIREAKILHNHSIEVFDICVKNVVCIKIDAEAYIRLTNAQERKQIAYSEISKQLQHGHGWMDALKNGSFATIKVEEAVQVNKLFDESIFDIEYVFNRALKEVSGLDDGGKKRPLEELAAHPDEPAAKKRKKLSKSKNGGVVSTPLPIIPDLSIATPAIEDAPGNSQLQNTLECSQLDLSTFECPLNEQDLQDLLESLNH